MTQPHHSHKFESARAARIAAVQAVFQIENTDHKHHAVMEEFQRYRLPSDDYPYAPNAELFNNLINDLYESYDSVQELMLNNLPDDWSMATLDPVLKIILMLAVSELLKPSAPLPAPVIISEYVDIACGFSGGKEGGFANKFLDHIAQLLHLPLNDPRKHKL